MEDKVICRSEQDKEYQKRRYEYRKENRLCTRCGKPLGDCEYLACDECRDKASNVNRMYRKKKSHGESWGEVKQTRKDSPGEIARRKKKQNQLKKDIIDSYNAGMSYGQWMAKKYMERKDGST